MIRSPRRGFSLLEVLLATSILLASLLVLGELAALGRRHADDVQQRTTALLICQAKLHAILAGAAPAQSLEEAEVEGSPGWLYSVEVEPAGRLGLVSLRVTVFRGAESAEGEPLEAPVEVCHLTRWMRDPDRAASAREDVLPDESVPFGQDLDDGDWLP